MIKQTSVGLKTQQNQGNLKCWAPHNRRLRRFIGNFFIKKHQTFFKLNILNKELYELCRFLAAHCG